MEGMIVAAACRSTILGCCLLPGDYCCSISRVSVSIEWMVVS